MSEHVRFWTPEGIRHVVGGSWLALPADPQGPLSGVSIDSREVPPGSIFVAIKGDRTDGHLYIHQAIEAGARLVIVSDEGALTGKAGSFQPAESCVLRVADTRTALLKMGAAWRKLLDGTRVIAVVGSNGKTTTVRLIDAVLGAPAGGAMRGTASIKSFNNAIGVPLTILRARRGDHYLICEVGTSSIGEIATLSRVVEPDIAVLTSIGREHMEFFGSLRGVATEEASVLDHLRASGLGVLTADAPELDEVLRTRASRGEGAGRVLIRCGLSQGADIRVARIESDGERTTFELNDRATFTIPLMGEHNAANASLAVAVGRRMRLTDDQIRAGLASVRGASMRLERQRIGTVDLINDAYNANPESVLAAVRTLAALEPGSVGKRQGARVLVLGDMLELGPEGPALHAEVLDAVANERGIARLALVGPLMAGASERVSALWGPSRVTLVQDASPANAARIAALVGPGDVVLLKASRGTRLERVQEAIERAHADPAASKSTAANSIAARLADANPTGATAGEPRRGGHA